MHARRVLAAQPVVLAEQLVRIAEGRELTVAFDAVGERDRVLRRPDAEAASRGEPHVAQAPEPADAHRFDGAALPLHERIQVRDLREERVARAAVFERAETVDRLGGTRRDAAPSAARLDVRGAGTRQRGERVVAGQRAQHVLPSVVRNDDAAARLAHERGGARRVLARKHRLAVRPRFDDFRHEAERVARHDDRARVPEERRAVALVDVLERDDQHAARAQALERRGIGVGHQHVRPSARATVDALRVQLGARNRIGSEPDDARARARRRTVQLREQQRFGLGRAQDHARARDRFDDRRQPRRRLVVQQRDEEAPLRNARDRVHRRRNAEVDEQHRIVAVRDRAHVREQVGTADALVEQRMRAYRGRHTVALHREQRFFVCDTIGRDHAEPVHGKRLRVVQPGVEGVDVGARRRGGRRDHLDRDAFEREMRREGEREALLAATQLAAEERRDERDALTAFVHARRGTAVTSGGAARRRSNRRRAATSATATPTTSQYADATFGKKNRSSKI